jgi:hypothetical protein
MMIMPPAKPLHCLLRHVSFPFMQATRHARAAPFFIPKIART